MNSKKNTPSTQNIDTENRIILQGKELWLIIGVNALISLIISLLVVLVIGPWAFGGAVSNFPLIRETAQPQGRNIQGTPLDELSAATQDSQIPATPTASPEPILYIVEAGDSLSGIAEQFGVSVQDILTANGFDDPDRIQAGQTLLIPVGGLVEATPTFTTEAPPSDTPIPFDPPGAGEEGTTVPPTDISITPTPTTTPIPTATAPPLDEIAVEITNVLGYGQLEEEIVVIFNRGPGVNLSGWSLSGSSLGDYQFPNLFLWNGGSVRIHTANGANTPSDLYWRQEEPYWFSGDTVLLKDALDETMSSYTIP